MTIQRITNHHSAPISACLRAFVLAAGSGISLSSQPGSRPQAQQGTDMANIFKGGNAYVTGITQGNSAILRGSA